MNRDDVEIIEKETKFQGFFRLDCYRLRHRLFEGGWSEELRREVYERGNAAAAVLYDPDLDTVVLIEQFRPGAFAAACGNPWIVEIIAGIIDDGESAEQVVRREAIEEAGCSITELVPIFDVFASPGGSSEIISLFCGRVDSRGVGGVKGMISEGENIRVFVESANEAFDRLNGDTVHNAMLVTGLQWLAQHRETLRQTWLA